MRIAADRQCLLLDGSNDLGQLVSVALFCDLLAEIVAERVVHQVDEYGHDSGKKFSVEAERAGVEFFLEVSAAAMVYGQLRRIFEVCVFFEVDDGFALFDVQVVEILVEAGHAVFLGFVRDLEYRLLWRCLEWLRETSKLLRRGGKRHAGRVKAVGWGLGRLENVAV